MWIHFQVENSNQANVYQSYHYSNKIMEIETKTFFPDSLDADFWSVRSTSLKMETKTCQILESNSPTASSK
jgi:hypothetical protein